MMLSRRVSFGYVMVGLSIHQHITPSDDPTSQPVLDKSEDRWQIELFFKALKQNMKIKTFVGTSANAVKTRI